VDVSVDAGRAPLAAPRVRALVRHVLTRERVRDAVLSVAFVTARRSARLHRQLLGAPGATDIITLEFTRAAGTPLVGEMYICADIARANAAVHGVSAREEYARLVVHGVLHALGHDHPVDARRTSSAMWRRQERHLATARDAGIL
jgi:probable rRNA maturation factor